MAGATGRRPHALAVAMIALAAPAIAFAQSWPSKPVRIIAAQSPGGATDMLARLFAQRLGEAWKQTVVVENRPGAGGSIGTELAARAPADGYTLLLSSAGPIVVNPSLYPRLGYDPQRDFMPIAFIAASPLVLCAHPSVPATVVRDVIALAKRMPGRLTYGSGGNGSPPHLTGEMFKVATGVDLIHVPFKGSAPSLLAVVSGQIDLAFLSVVTSLPQVNAGRLRAVAVTAPRRSPVMPQVPTMIESGLAGFESQQWFGLFAPSGLAKELAERLAADAARIVAAPETRERLASEGGEPGTLTRAEFAEMIRADLARWARVIKASGAKAE